MNTEYKRYGASSIGLFSGIVEVWKDIKGYEGHYQISSFGRVKSLERFRQSKLGSIAKVKERTLKLKISKSGYLVAHLRNGDKESHPSVHRLVAEAFIPNVENKPTVNHIDTNKQNNSVSNLEWNTHSEQMRHAVSNQLLEVRGAPKYTKQFKNDILQYKLSNPDTSLFRLAKIFNVSERTAGRIVNEGVNPRPTTRSLKDGTVIVEEILSKEQVIEIKKLRVAGHTLSSIARKFNRSISQIHRITRGESRNTNIE